MFGQNYIPHKKQSLFIKAYSNQDGFLVQKIGDKHFIWMMAVNACVHTDKNFRMPSKDIWTAVWKQL